MFHISLQWSRRVNTPVHVVPTALARKLSVRIIKFNVLVVRISQLAFRTGAEHC